MTMQRLPMTGELIESLHQDYSLLDLGCRTMDLKDYLSSCKMYRGADLVGGKGVFECDLERGLGSFADDSFDVVVALDVLEHLENCHDLMHEMIRVAKKNVIISLPNMFYIKFRFSFFFKGFLSGKYSFSRNPILDRHRWIMSFEEARNFVDANSAEMYVQHLKIVPKRGRTRFIVTPIESWLAEKFPNAFAYGSLHVISLS